MASESEIAAMRRAVDLAERGRWVASPNPTVGCVVLDASGIPVGEGYYDDDRVLHAEVRALIQAGDRALNGTAVVTLEPCKHVGRTGPCTAAIIDAGIRRVVVAVRDPHPRAGGGSEVLRAAGVDVEVGVLADAGERVNAPWLTFVRRDRPYVTWKYAATLDGRSAAADGSSQWITSAEARADVHRLRAESDAVVVGSETVLADDPRLTARAPGVQRQPLRVVVDTAARLPARARVLDGAAPTLLAIAEDAPDTPLEAQCGVIRLPRATGGLDVAALLAELHARDVVSALLEGGPRLAASFLRDGLVDRVVAYLAPMLLGEEGRAAVGEVGIATLTGAVRLKLADVARIGPDVRVTAERPAAGEGRREGRAGKAGENQ